MDNIKLSNYKLKLNKFYFEKAKPVLKKYNVMRKENLKAFMMLGIIVLSFVIFILGCIFSNILFFAIFAGIVLLLFALSENIAGTYNNPSNNSIFDIDKEMKFELMNDFCAIFDDLKWFNSYTTLLASNDELQAQLDETKFDGKVVNYKDVFDVYKEYKKSAKYLRYKQEHEIEKKYKENIKGLRLLDCFILYFDDILTGSYNDVNFKIMEASTYFGGPYWGYLFLVLFFTIFVGALIYSFSGLLLIVFLPLLPILIIAVPILVVAVIAAGIYCVVRYLTQSKFRGLLIEFDMNKSFEGHTIILERGLTTRGIDIPKEEFEEVNLEDTKFISKYKVYSDSQVEARFILTPGVIERLNNLHSVYKAKYLRVAFKNNKITIAIHIDKDVLRLADNAVSDTTQDNFINLFNEIISIYDLIEQLKLTRTKEMGNI